MCGICGVVNFHREHPVAETDLRNMCRVIRHRGPDDEGVYVKENIGLGMRRLSIIDLASGHQPITNEDGTVWIVFNGEIYNYQSVRQNLIQAGHRFSTNSDTETILHAYEEYGEHCPEYLNGMFAFAIWDERKHRFFMARDRLGIKPLYYYLDSEQLIFGSELKSILQLPSVPRRVNLEALDNFLTFEYIPAPLSIFQGINKLEPGHSLSWENGKTNVRQFWSLQFQLRPAAEDVICEELRSILQDAVKIRLMSEVPLGAFLSGGIDSSTIVALMSRVMDQPVKTFSIGFEDATYNELKYARLIAKKFNTEHHEFTIKPNAVELTETLVKNFVDEPFGDFSLFPTYLVSKMARQFVTVVLSGDGGDELFAGYDQYIANRIAKMYQMIPRVLRRGVIEKLVAKIPPTDKKKGLVNRTKRFVEGAMLPPDLAHTRWMIFLTEQERKLLFTPDIMQQVNQCDPYGFIRHNFKQAPSRDALEQQQYVDLKTYLVDDILVKVDRMSMATSLEARVPFLDYRVVEFAATIPSRLKLAGLSHQKTKYILKKAMEGILPTEIIYRNKEGFSIPIKNWLRHELRPMMEEVLAPARLKAEGYFNVPYIEQLKNEHLMNIQNHSHRLWALMIFEIWYANYIKSDV
ncbi:asparagine synthase (glutamine-hydrolyzing) [candidate division KSB1 bacterium]|nr:asparagine synthase (glutamine-hydrolyzing) [candidate division KSB1 bacterium]